MNEERNELNSPSGSVVEAEADKKAEDLMCEYTCSKDWTEMSGDTWSASDVHDILTKAFLLQNAEN